MNVNRLPCVGPGGQRCSCCRATSGSLRAARNAAKRAALAEQENDLLDILLENEEEDYEEERRLLAEREKEAQIEEMWAAFDSCAIKVAHGKAQWGPGWDGLWGRPQ